MTKKQSWKKIQMAFVAGGVMMTTFAAPLATPTAQAFGLTDLIGGIVGVSSTYSYYLNSLLAIGNDPHKQNMFLEQDMTENGRCYDEAPNAGRPPTHH